MAKRNVVGLIYSIIIVLLNKILYTVITIDTILIIIISIIHSPAFDSFLYILVLLHTVHLNTYSATKCKTNKLLLLCFPPTAMPRNCLKLNRIEMDWFELSSTGLKRICSKVIDWSSAKLNYNEPELSWIDMNKAELNRADVKWTGVEWIRFWLGGFSHRGHLCSKHEWRCEISPVLLCPKSEPERTKTKGCSTSTSHLYIYLPSRNTLHHKHML